MAFVHRVCDKLFKVIVLGNTFVTPFPMIAKPAPNNTTHRLGANTFSKNGMLEAV